MTPDELAALRRNITGEVCLNNDVALLMAGLVGGSRLHLEVGAWKGGSAILAVLAGAQHVITIDSMENNIPPVIILDNFARCGVAHRISLVKARSNPWPLPPDVRPDTAFIDGDHSYEGCLADWLHLKDITRDIILLHDYQPEKPEVMRVIDEVVRQDTAWVEAARTGNIIAFKRNGAG